MKKEKVKNYIVSSSGWEIEIDQLTARKAALDALIFMYNKYREKLLISTTIMVTPSEEHVNDLMTSTEFFATYSIFNELGMHRLAFNLIKYNKISNEIKYIKK
jgi:hypothetical protein